MNEPTHLDIFSGIGGFALAAKWAGFRTVGFCERDAYCKRVLAKHWPSVNCQNDIHTLDGKQFTGIDLLTGGFPCQPFSCAGKQRGKEDNRFLWPEMLRVIQEAKPAWIVGENVAGIVNLALDDCLFDLESAGYSAIPFIIPACAVDAPHKRDRVWIVANATRELRDGGRGARNRRTEHPVSREALAEAQGSRGQQQTPESNPGSTISRGSGNGPVSCSQTLADANEPGLQGRDSEVLQECAGKWTTRPSSPFAPNANSEQTRRATESRSQRCEWEPEPSVGRVANGIPSRMDRLKALGNAIVPQVAFQILRAIRQQIA